MSADTPQEPISTDGSEVPEDVPSRIHIAWTALTAPLTGALLVTGLASVWMTALVVPQGATPEELLVGFPYAQAQAIRSLGLQDVVTSWPSLFFILLLLLHAIGLMVEARSRTTRGRSSALEDAWSARAQATIARPVDAVLASLEKGDHGHFYRDAQAPRVWRGLWREGLALVGAGLVVLLISIPVGRSLGLEARVTLSASPGLNVSKPVSTVVRDFRGWVDGESPVELTCEDPDPADGLRRRSCVLQSGDAAIPMVLAAGATVDQGPVSLTPVRERPRRLAGMTSLLLQREGEGPRVLRGAPGRTYELTDKTRITAFEGPEGPLVVARPGAEGRPLLLAPGGSGREPAAGRSIAGVPGWKFDVAVSADPASPLQVAGGVLLLVGLLLMVVVPHLEVRLLSTEDGGVVALARSYNRPDLATDWCERLSANEEIS